MKKLLILILCSAFLAGCPQVENQHKHHYNQFQGQEGHERQDHPKGMPPTEDLEGRGQL